MISFRQIISSMRLYFWPLIMANIVMMSITLSVAIWPALVFGLSLSVLASYGFLINDLCDRHIDRINRSGHFEHSTATTLTSAIFMALVLLIVGLACSAFLGRAELTTALVISGLLFL